MARNGLLVGLVVVMSCLAVAAQAPAVVEVASVKVTNLNPQSGGGRQILPSGVSMPGTDLMMTIPWIFDIPVSFVETRIDWSHVDRGRSSLLNKRYDIEIRGTGDAQALARMVFAERFGLRTHTETRQMRLWALTVKTPANLGPNLKPSTVNCMAWSRAAAFKQPGAERPAPCSGTGSRSAGSIAELIELTFPRYSGRPVVDRTNLQGNYEWDVQFRVTDPNEYEAQKRQVFEDRLGLTLKDITGPYDVLVIDALHEPTPN